MQRSTERARRIEDLQDQMLRIEARVDERNQQIANLKRTHEDQPPPALRAAALQQQSHPVHDDSETAVMASRR